MYSEPVRKNWQKPKEQLHKCRGLTNDFSQINQVTFIIYGYIEDIICTAPVDMNGTAPDLARAGLFTMNESSHLLDEKRVDFFHSTTTRQLFAAKRVRPDIQVADAYICTQVRAPTVSDYKKLTRVVKYLCITVYLPLVFGWDEYGSLLWSIDTLFAINNGMRSHNYNMLTFGKGAAFSMSNKQNVNSTSSTVAEITGAS